MKRRHIKFYFIFSMLTAALWTLSASAAVRISLITVNPKPVIFNILGHTLIEVQNTNTPNQATVYDYGKINPSRFMWTSQPMIGFLSVLRSKIKTHPSKFTGPVRNGVPSIVWFRYLKAGNANRKVTIDPLNLSARQASTFIKLLDADVYSGAYTYSNYSANCTTKVRDRLFSDKVLGRKMRIDLERRKIYKSRNDILSDQINKAAMRSRTQTVLLMPRSVMFSSNGRQTLAAFNLMGLGSQYSSGRQFYSSVKTADTIMDDYFGATKPFPSAFHKYFFGRAMTRKPISVYSSLFTPENLRQALIKLKVIDDQKTNGK